MVSTKVGDRLGSPCVDSPSFFLTSFFIIFYFSFKMMGRKINISLMLFYKVHQCIGQFPSSRSQSLFRFPILIALPFLRDFSPAPHNIRPPWALKDNFFTLNFIFFSPSQFCYFLESTFCSSPIKLMIARPILLFALLGTLFLFQYSSIFQ